MDELREMLRAEYDKMIEEWKQQRRTTGTTERNSIMRNAQTVLNKHTETRKKEGWVNMTPAQAMADATALGAKLDAARAENIAAAKRIRDESLIRKAGAETHAQRVEKVKKKSFTDAAAKQLEIKKRNEIEAARRSGGAAFFARSLDTAQKGADLIQAAADAEADTAEAKARGESATPGGGHYAEYRRLMDSGKSREARAYWRDNEKAIQNEQKAIAAEGSK